MKEKLMKSNGITLLALVVTIIVLLILAGVAISMLSGENGILKKAVQAKEETDDAQVNEAKDLKSMEDLIEKSIRPKSELESAQGRVLSETETKTVKDIYGNEVKVPAGFKITSDASDVTQGVVIEDVSASENSKGSQFVWIPVGTVYTDVERTEAKAKTIELARYVFDSNGNIMADRTCTKAIDKLYPSEVTDTTDTSADYITDNGSLDESGNFVECTKKNKGYYIGRYEAGDSSATSMRILSTTTGNLVCKENQFTYNYINKGSAKSKSEAMYNKYDNFKSLLLNSFAWDTAIVFIQTFGQENFSRKIIGKNANMAIKTGMAQDANGLEDKQLNIYDMASINPEWSTENRYKPSQDKNLCVGRGGNGSSSEDAKWNYVSVNYGFSSSDSVANVSFRPILYIK